MCQCECARVVWFRAKSGMDLNGKWGEWGNTVHFNACFTSMCVNECAGVWIEKGSLREQEGELEGAIPCKDNLLINQKLLTKERNF